MDEIQKKSEAKKKLLKSKAIKQRQFFERFEAEACAANIREAELRVACLDEYLEEFTQVTLDLSLTLEEDADVEAANDEDTQFEDEIFRLKAKFLNLIDKFRVIPLNEPPGQPQNPQQQIHYIQMPPPVSNLPEFQLPKFDGLIENFQTFHDTFKSMVADKPIAKIEKLMYLQNCCSGGKAETLIERFQLIGDNFDIAWKELCDRYDNQRLLADKHFAELLKSKTVNKDQPNDLRHLLDCYSTHIKQLDQLVDDPEKLWNLMIVHLVTWRLDEDTKKAWEGSLKREEIPTWDKMEKFLDQKCRVLENIQHTSRAAKSTVNKTPGKTPPKSSTFFNTGDKIKCNVCEKDHPTFRCDVLNNQSVKERRITIKDKLLCFNCLQPKHSAANCLNKNTCRECQMKHHTILHETGDNQENPEGSKTVLLAHVKKHKQVLLLTAIVNVKNSSGEFIPCRALLDSGSESNLMTERFSQLLKLKKNRHHIKLNGIGQEPITITSMVESTIKSRNSNYKIQAQFLVVPHIARIPDRKLSFPVIKLPENGQLADPQFATPEKVDLIIGAEIFLDVLKNEKKTVIPQQLFARNSEFGWILYGNLTVDQHKLQQSCLLSCEQDLNEQLKRFWEVEHLTIEESKLSSEEKFCEENFANTTRRDKEGRFVVELPVKAVASQLQSNRATAVRRLHAMEKKLAGNPPLREMYVKFMEEYEILGHMKEVSQVKTNTDTIVHYLPHHSVLKPSSTTTKLRVVFNASCKASNGLSLNDILCVGPKVQQDLFQTLTRFCQFKFGAIADVQMMYRQTLVNENQTHLQRIVWRKDPKATIKDYALQTVTYGTAPGSFLATRCLKELSIQNREKFPEASEIIANDFYMDDLITGFNDLREGVQLQSQIIHILKSAKYPLRKWMSNHEDLLSNIDQDDRETVNLHDKDDSIKTLGLYWKPKSDKLSYKIQQPDEELKVTKRNVLSTIAKWYDPLGRINPVTVTGKLFMQQLFRLKLDWDESIPAELERQWKEFTKDLKCINQIEFDRHCLVTDPNYIEIHGFSDASEAAYGACIYILSRNAANDKKVQLVAAKSKVAPIEKVTLPRLELLGAKLLAELYQKVSSSFRLQIAKTILWTDSTIVLCWLKMDENRLQQFVFNRVQKIKEFTRNCAWRHVNSKSNPADIVSRGLSATELINANIWWDGPSFLTQPESEWPSNLVPVPDLIPEQRIFIAKETWTESILESCSSLKKIGRVFGWVSRFIKNCREKVKGSRIDGPLKFEESTNGFKLAIRLTQIKMFPIEMKALMEGKKIDSNSALKSLSVFLGGDDLIRVGGRLKNANIPYEHKHPILLPKHHNLTLQIAREIHIKNMHCSQNALVSFIRQEYWPIRCKNIARAVTHECVTCAKLNARPIQQLMGDLPSYRVQLSAPFHHTGVDYAGPINIRVGGPRSRTTMKSWIAIFVCMSTKAVHLELVSGLSTKEFLNAMDRFIARRGLPAHMHSDQGTNFVGANSELQAIIKQLNTTNFKTFLKSNSKYEDITWHFIPPRSPNFGGLWEAAVKIVKTHLIKIVGSQLLNYEELATVLYRVEAVVNSRPLTPLSEDPNDLLSLTPAHFLVGRPLNARPQQTVTSTPNNRLRRFHLMEKLSQQFWDRFQTEYLHQLQQRTKWFNKNTSIKPGMLVAIKEDNLPPLKWQLGRIEEVTEGKDGLIRVAKVKTSHGSYDRCVSKICPIFVEAAFNGRQYD